MAVVDYDSSDLNVTDMLTRLPNQGTVYRKTVGRRQSWRLAESDFAGNGFRPRFESFCRSRHLVNRFVE